MITYRELSSLEIDLGYSAKMMYSLSNSIRTHYHEASIPKGNGEYRKLYVPDEELKVLQKRIADIILARVEISPYATAYPVGTRCVVLAAGEEDNYESIAFINVGQDGMIERIKISTDGRYHFKVDEPVKVQSLFDDIEIPESVVEPIILRAKFHGLIDEDYDPSVISNEMDDYYYFEDNAQKMLDALTENPQPDVEETFANIFGYLFAKAIEQAYNEEYAPKVNWRLTASYCPDDAFHGVITSTFDEKKHRKLEKALELGKQFFNDFSGYMEMSGVGEEHFVETIKLALVTVQWIGQKYKDNCFKERGE